MNKKEPQSSPFLLKKTEASSKSHQDMLGFDLPDSYFTQSKSEILNLISQKGVRKHQTFNFSSFYKYPIAASIILFLGLSVWITFQINRSVKGSQKTEIVNISDLQLSDDEVLLQSLLMDDSNLDQFLNEYIVENAIAENNLINEKNENILINSMFINDSLLDSYIDENLTDALIL